MHKYLVQMELHNFTYLPFINFFRSFSSSYRLSMFVFAYQLATNNKFYIKIYITNRTIKYVPGYA